MKTFMVEIPDDVYPMCAGVYLGDVLDYEFEAEKSIHRKEYENNDESREA